MRLVFLVEYWSMISADRFNNYKKKIDCEMKQKLQRKRERERGNPSSPVLSSSVISLIFVSL